VGVARRAGWSWWPAPTRSGHPAAAPGNAESDRRAKKKIDALQKEVDAQLDKILTDEQKKQMKEFRDRARRSRVLVSPGGGGPGGPPPGGEGVVPAASVKVLIHSRSRFDLEAASIAALQIENAADHVAPPA
jgi:hypothetical protein